jgi:chondroitin sulfate synthase
MGLPIKLYTCEFSVGSKAAVEGSPLGMYLQSLKAQDELQFTTLMTDVAGTLTSKEEAKKQVQLHPSPQVKTADVVQSAQEKASISIAVTPQSLVKTVDAVQSAAQEKALILIAVVTSRDMLESRVAAIASTWAQEGQVPDDIEIKFFVGASSDRDSVLVDGSLEDRAALAKYAGLLDRSAIVVMPEVVDDEYPPVYKNSAMIKHLERIAAAKDQENGNSYEWIYKVDDDTYVNIHALRQFVESKSAKEFQFLGQKGTGKREDKEGLIKEGLVKPYCMGGPGYILSRSTLQETARGIDSCVEHAESSPMRHSLWHSDVVIGICVYRKMGIGCWDGDDYYSQKQKFTHNFKGLENYVADADLVEAVSMHPFKEPGGMLL